MPSHANAWHNRHSAVSGVFVFYKTQYYPSTLSSTSPMQKRVSLYLRLFSVRYMSLISGLFLCRCLEHCNTLLDHFNAYRTDFSVSKNSPHKTVLLCLLMSLRCTCSFSRPSTADVLSPRPYAHTTNNLGSRSPSIAPVFSFQCSRPI